MGGAASGSLILVDVVDVAEVVVDLVDHGAYLALYIAGHVLVEGDGQAELLGTEEVGVGTHLALEAEEEIGEAVDKQMLVEVSLLGGWAEHVVGHHVHMAATLALEVVIHLHAVADIVETVLEGLPDIHLDLRAEILVGELDSHILGHVEHLPGSDVEFAGRLVHGAGQSQIADADGTLGGIEDIVPKSVFTLKVAPAVVHHLPVLTYDGEGTIEQVAADGGWTGGSLCLNGRDEYALEGIEGGTDVDELLLVGKIDCLHREIENWKLKIESCARHLRSSDAFRAKRGKNLET